MLDEFPGLKSSPVKPATGRHSASRSKNSLPFPGFQKASRIFWTFIIRGILALFSTTMYFPARSSLSSIHFLTYSASLAEQKVSFMRSSWPIQRVSFQRGRVYTMV